MMKRGWCFLLLTILVAAAAQAGNGIWKNFTSMKDVSGVARAGTTYWAATSGGLFSWKEGSSTYQQYTTAEGLQGVDLTAVSVDSSGDVWAGASNGVIQVLTPATGVFRTLLSIANSGQTNKRINAFSVYGDTLLICTDFGLSLFRLAKFEFGDTYTLFGAIPQGTRISVLSAVIFQGSLWAAITDGQASSFVARASLSDPNLITPSAWTLYNVAPGSQVTGVAVSNGKVYAGTTRGLFFFSEGAGWTGVTSLSGANILCLYGAGGQLLAGTGANEIFTVDGAGNAQQSGAVLPARPRALSASNSGVPVVGTLGSGILYLNSTWTSRFPNGPNSNQFVNVVVDQNGVVWCASGAASGQGIYRYDGSQWVSFTRSNSPLPANEFYRVAVGCNGSIWGSSWGRGVVEFPGGTPTLDAAHVFGKNVGMTWTTGNDTSFIATSNVVCDGHGNTWVNVFGASNKRSLAVRTADGTWRTLPAFLQGSIPLAEFAWGTIDRGLAVDANDNLWAVVHDQPYGGIVSFGNAGAIDSTVAFRVTSAQGLPSDQVRTIIVDKENSLWVGTDKGIGIVLDPSNPLRTGAVAIYKPLFGLVVNTIAVDPLNQKWVGTNAGVFLLSPDGTQQIASYTVENTGGKLIDNDVKSIAVDEKSGTIYFGTNAGLASLTTSAAAPKTAFDGLRVYPNPYYVPASGPLTVDGLMENSTLKVLTASGALVREVQTPGGRVGYWDGTDQQGKLVASGIYIISAYSESGATANGKVAVIRK